MMKQKLAVIILLFFCFGMSLANAQYYPYPPPPPLGYLPPPPYASPLSFDFPPDAGPYFRLGGGPSFYLDGTLKQYGTVANAPVSYDTGFALDAGMGYAFNKYISVGFNTGYLETWIHSVNSPGFSTGNAYISNVPFMGEATLSLPIPHTILVPYISGAVGGSSSQFWANGYGFGNIQNGWVSGSAWDTVFAYSASAGLRFKISRHFSAAIAYNFFSTADTSYTYYNGFGGSINVDLKGVRANTAMFSLRWIF
jgi:opacity protein-like surface antigen